MKIFNLISYLTLFLGFTLVCYAIYWLVIPLQVISVDQPQKIITSNIKSGDVVFFESNYCKYEDYQADVNRVLIGNGFDVNLVSTSSKVDKGCYHKQSSIVIPPNTPTGVYKIQTNTRYYINFLRSVPYTNATEYFPVTKP